MGSISQYCPQTKQYWEEKISAEPEFKHGAAGWEAQTLPLCYAAPLIQNFEFITYTSVVRVP